ncbi:MAG: hypothetical protein AAB019_11365 [Planctomycetota bacterium]
MRELKGNWRDIFNGFSVALDFKKLLAGFIGMVLTLVVVGGIPFLTTSYKLTPNNFSAVWTNYGYAWTEILNFPWWKSTLIIASVYFLTLLIWSYFGGVISRIAAVNLTKDEGLEFSKALSFGTQKYLSYFFPWIIPVIGFLFFWLCNFAGGLVGQIPVIGEFLVVLFLPLAILSGFIMVFIAVGFVFGGCLFTPTISVEGSDSFDAISRSFSYLYARPWHYIFYQITSLVYGVITTAFVWTFGLLMLWTAFRAVHSGMGDKFRQMFIVLEGGQETIPLTVQISAYIMGIWLILILGLMLAYVISYKYTSQSIIYLLMRKKVDDIDVKEIYEETEEELPLTGSDELKSEEKPVETETK